MALVELGRFSAHEANLLVGALESHGIMAFAFDTGMSIAEGSFSFLRARVMVDDEDLEAARAVAESPAQ